jgi:hypothetical protein
MYFSPVLTETSKSEFLAVIRPHGGRVDIVLGVIYFKLSSLNSSLTSIYNNEGRKTIIYL